jgi:hypothetical protein
MPINWQEVKKAIKEYKKRATEAKKKGFQVIGFIEWAKRHYGKA